MRAMPESLAQEKLYEIREAANLGEVQIQRDCN